MTIATLNPKQQRIVEEIPPIHDFSEFYIYVSRSHEDHDYLHILDKFTNLNDNVVSEWLNISTRTFRNYKNNESLTLKDNTREHILLLLALYKHGAEVFGNNENFEKWLSSGNILLDQKTPVSFLDTVLGIKLIDNRLTAMEYGENV